MSVRDGGAAATRCGATAPTSIIAASIDPGSTGITTEQLWARRLDEERFEVCCIPFFAYDVALGRHGRGRRQPPRDAGGGAVAAATSSASTSAVPSSRATT